MRATRVRKISFIKDMPLVEVLVVLVVAKSGGDCLSEESLDEHCHCSGFDTVYSQPTLADLPVHDQLLGLLQHVLVQPALD